jgi:GxxExxY protein
MKFTPSSARRLRFIASWVVVFWSRCIKYQEAMQIELAERKIPFEAQKELVISYKGRPLQKTYCADLICYGQIVVELKAMNRLSGTEEAQILNYLKATGLRVGLLINFGAPDKLDWKRFVK